MAVWLVRAGRNGELEEFVVENNQAVIGWDRLSDLSGVESRDELKAMCGDVYAERHPMAIAILVGQLWAFRERMSPRDLVVLPFKTRSGVAIGEVTGSYQYRPESAAGARHTRPVKWLRTDIPRSEFGQDLRYSLNAGMTVCRIKRNNAEERIKAVLAGKPDPGLEDEEVIIEEIPDLEAYAREQIRDFIARSFKEHELAHLVDDILKAQGYKTHLSPPGPDGGVDIIAGRGPMGFDSPRLCVQVKSGDSSQDVSVVRQLQGVIQNFKAEQGLIVAWGGLTKDAVKLARQLFFQVRLWDGNDLVEGVLRNYNQLSEEIRAELPLKRIWALVREESE